MTGKCGQCKFYDGTSREEKCRRYPPSATGMHIPTGSGGYEMIRTGWPKTWIEDWCGEFKTNKVEQQFNEADSAENLSKALYSLHNIGKE